MNSLLRRHVDILAERGDVEDLFVLYRKSVSMGKEGVEIRRRISLKIPLLARLYGSSRTFDSFRNFMSEYDFRTSPLRLSELVYERTIIHQSKRNRIPYTFDEFLKLFRRGGFEKFVVFPFRVNEYDEYRETTWDEEGMPSEKVKDAESVRLTCSRREGVMYQFERDKENLIVSRYTLPVYRQLTYHEPREIKPAIVTNFADYQKDLADVYEQIDDLYFGSEYDYPYTENYVGVYPELRYDTELEGALKLAYDLADYEESVRIGVEPNWHYTNYYAAYYLNEDTIRVRSFSLDDETDVFHVADFRVPYGLPFGAYPSYFLMFHRVEHSGKKFKQITLPSLEGRNYALADVEPYYIISDELLQDANEFRIIEYDRDENTGVYAHKVILSR